jgi:transposase InsO family protein
MSRAANCYDNAFMESCFGTIKTELEMTEYQDIPTALQEASSLRPRTTTFLPRLPHPPRPLVSTQIDDYGTN